MVEVRQRTLCSRVAVEEEEKRGGGGEEQATDIKSINSHLTGGEVSTIKSHDLLCRSEALGVACWWALVQKVWTWKCCAAPKILYVVEGIRLRMCAPIV